MIVEYISEDQDFSTRTKGTYLTIAFMTPVCGLAVVAITYGAIYHDGSKRSKLAKIIEGLSHMDMSSIVITLLICSAVMIGLMFFLKTYYRDREIVVGLKFNDHLKELTVRTKTISGLEYLRTHKYFELSLSNGHLGDGMTPPMYRTLTLEKGEYLAGHIYEDHFTWDEASISKIKAKLKSVL